MIQRPRGAALRRPGRTAAGRLVPGDRRGGRAPPGRGPGAPGPRHGAAMHAYADLRVESNQTSAPVPTALREGRPVVVQQLTDAQLQEMTTPAARAALAPLRV